MAPLRLENIRAEPRDRTRDKALLVAIEYRWPEHPEVTSLNTPHKDLERVYKHLTGYWGYLKQNITILKDGPKSEVDASKSPTRQNILREIDNLVEDIQPGDRRVFFFAGHCYQIKNRRGTEWDGKDEVILTANHNGPPDENVDYGFAHPIRAGLIIDNELRERLVNSIPCGARLVAIADTCHSGTLFDLDWHWHCDTQDKFCTIPSPPLSGKMINPSSTRKRSKPSRRNARARGKASEYVYRSNDAHEGVLATSTSSTGGSAKLRMKTLFSSRDTAWTPKEQPQGPNSQGQKENSVEMRERSKGPVDGWGVTEMCTSPTQEDVPWVTSLSSAEDHQQAWAKTKEDTMTSVSGCVFYVASLAAYLLYGVPAADKAPGTARTPTCTNQRAHPSTQRPNAARPSSDYGGVVQTAQELSL
ncbi:peptidase C14, caspase domain-containing protein [Irpex lacteus]|nr:peptidase C14, caspase domain-containing protein [Irpex lacteus]